MKAFTVLFLLFTAAFAAALPAQKRALAVVPEGCSDAESLDVAEGSDDRRGCNEDF
ncbi:hypothetical protein C8R47DRAFT_1212421 [Mycena vitilis]|nr:hypothetical protein C8R47DRAFT_1212421 [Mycena vitilis]